MSLQLLSFYGITFGVSLYGLILVSYLIAEIYFAFKETTRQIKNYPEMKRKLTEHLFSQPLSVLVLMPFYKESFESVRETVDSLTNQSLSERIVISIVDDGSPDPSTFDKLRDHYKHNSNIILFRKKVNEGKREGQVTAWEMSSKAFPLREFTHILTVDSDTTFHPNAIENIMSFIVWDNLEACSGTVLAKKQDDWLSPLLRIRYWSACMQERMAQGYFGNVLCCSGPFSVWKANIWKKVIHKYINQRFLGEKCTYGDDRHLTNLFLQEGAKIKICSFAVAFTETPKTLKQWLKQQERWSKSFYRETYWLFTRNRKNIHPWSALSNLVGLFLPFLLVNNILLGVFFRPTIFTVVGLSFSVIFAAFLRGTYGFLMTGDRGFWRTPIYGFLHLIVFGTRVKALFSLKTTSWGTR